MRLPFFLLTSILPVTAGFSVVVQPYAKIQRTPTRRRQHVSSSHLRAAAAAGSSSPSKSDTSPKRRTPKPTKRNWTYSATTITGKWRENFDDLKEYEAKHGHTRVPYNYAPNPRLGRWVARQRSLYNEMQSPSFSATHGTKMRPSTVLTQERIDALNGIGFSFESPRKRTWTKRFDELCTYKALHGDCLVPHHYDAIPGLGIWVRNQRTLYRNILLGRKQSGNLSPEKIAALQSIGFVWDTQRSDQWKKRFDELVEFKAVYGHCSVPEKYHENPSLGAWVVNQRTSYKNFISGGTGGNAHKEDIGVGGFNTSRQNNSSLSQWRANGGKSLTPAKIKALESIGFCWDQNQKNWYSMYERLKQYKMEREQQLKTKHDSDHKSTSSKRTNDAEDNNNSDDVGSVNNALFHIPPEDVANRDLRLWISVQRKEYSNYMYNKNNNNNDHRGYTKRSSMTSRRKRALDDIGFPWSINKQKYGSDVGPTVDDWTALFEQMREKGIDKNARPKEHWFEGQSVLSSQEDFDDKDFFSDDDLLELWNMEDED